MHTVGSTPVTADALWAEVCLMRMSAPQVVWCEGRKLWAAALGGSRHDRCKA